MKPAYDQLGQEYEGSSSVVIGDVDCTVESDLCSKVGANGYPTLKYYLAGEMKDYSGGRDYDGLKKFVQENLEKLCDATTGSDCSEKELAFIEKVKGAADLETQLNRLQAMAAGTMKSELKQWVIQRLNILKQLSKSAWLLRSLT